MSQRRDLSQKTRRRNIETLECRWLMASDIVINEFLAANQRGIRDQDGNRSDWIELLNIGEEPISLQDYALTDSSQDLHRWRLPAVTLEPHATLLVFASGKDRTSPTGELHTNFKLAAEGEFLALVRILGTEITFGFDPRYPVQTDDVSYGLAANHVDRGYFSTPTPGIANNGVPRLDTVSSIVINEIMYHPTSGLAEDEYIELFNSGTTDVPLEGWSLAKGVDFRFGNRILKAGEYLAIAADAAQFAKTYGTRVNVVGGWTGRLSNQGEEVVLVDSLNRVVDRIAYADEGDWSQRIPGPLDRAHRGWIWSDDHDGGGRSLELVNAALDNQIGQNWQASLTVGGSPGTRNTSASVDSAPLVSQVSHSPIVPSASEAVAIHARVLDDAEAGIVPKLRWRVDGQTTFQSIPMQFDPLPDDGNVGGKRYSATIPAQRNLTVVEYYIEARGASGHLRLYPNGDPTLTLATEAPRLLYQVDDLFASEVRGRTADTAQPIFRLIMTEAERAELARIGATSSEAASDAQMNGTFIRLDGISLDFRYTVGIRNRGKGSRNSPPNNYRVNFPQDQPWNHVTAINLNSKSPATQVLGSALFQQAGVVAAEATPVHVRVNGADLSTNSATMFGSYSYVEVVNDEFVDRHFPTNRNGNVYSIRWDGRVQGDLRYEGDDPDIYRGRYAKSTNVSEDDWSDLIQLVDVLAHTPAETFVEQLSEIVDIDQWLRYLATDVLLMNRETSPSQGIGDDYDLYRGGTDRRFRFIPHDLDSILGATNPASDGSIWLPAEMDGLTRMLTHPQIAPRYYQALLDQIEKTLDESTMTALVKQKLGSWVPASYQDELRAFYQRRKADVLAQIPTELTVLSNVTALNNLWTTHGPGLDLRGTAPAASTTRVEVAGIPALYDVKTATWSITTGPILKVGLNRLSVRALGPSGEVSSEKSIDVWRQPTPTVTLGGTLTSNTTLDAQRVWNVDRDLVIPEGITLTIEPGTLVTTANDIAVQVNGTLRASGTPERPIRFTRRGTTGTWNGIIVRNTLTDNRLEHVDLAFSDGNDHSVMVDHARLTMDHVRWLDTTRTSLEVLHPSLTVTNSYFPSVVDNETVHGSGLSGSEYFVLRGNTFGTTTGYSDIVDFSGGQRPGPILQVVDNLFLGGSDDALDLDGTDAYIANNEFRHFHKNNTSDSSSNAIATGVDSGNASELVIVGNRFFDVDHALLLKERSSATFEHNFVWGAIEAAINFDEPNRVVDPGAGIKIVGSVFAETPAVLLHEQADPVFGVPAITIDYSLVPSALHGRGIGNIDGDPVVMNLDTWELATDSPTLGTGPLRTNMGPIPLVAAIGGEPLAETDQTSATLVVGGPDIVEYRYRRVGEAAFGPAIPITTPIQLTRLAAGSYAYEVIGKNSLGTWQDENKATRSRSWNVIDSIPSIQIHEVMAAESNDRTGLPSTPSGDWIELFNPSALAQDISGMSLSDDASQPRKFVFPQGTTMEPGSYLVVRADDLPGEGLGTGFRLNSDGETVSLFRTQGQTSVLVDHVTFGLQIPGFSIGDLNGTWGLTFPTPGSLNHSQATGSLHELMINEWFTSGKVRLDHDFLEIANPGSLPIDLTGLLLTDASTWPERHSVAPLSFIAPRGFTAFQADGKPEAGAAHLSFRLDSGPASIVLSDRQQRRIDQVSYGPQGRDFSEGRDPNSHRDRSRFVLPTPGLANGDVQHSNAETRSLVPFDANWTYDASGTDRGTTWREPNFNDSNWKQGVGAIGVDESPLAIPIRTKVTLGPTTYYFRKSFSWQESPDTYVDLQLQLETQIDDGAVFYLNGHELIRQNMPNGTIGYATEATTSVSNAVRSGTVTVPSDWLVMGENVLAAEVHQSGQSSTDVVFAAHLTALVTRAEGPTTSRNLRLLQHLRITEVMYHPTGTGAEFIELQNTGSLPLPVGGVAIGGGVDFVFPEITIPARGFVVVTNDLAAFRTQYGTLPTVAGTYVGSLANGGEEVKLLLPSPQTVAIHRFIYDDDPRLGWPAGADGSGVSLEIELTEGDYADPSNWQASGTMGGTPGRRGILVGDLNGDQFVNALDIDRLFVAVTAHDNQPLFDLDQSGSTDQRDVSFLITDILHTRRGDVNLDGTVGFNDFLVLSSQFGQAGGWSLGDSTGDQIVDFADFLWLASGFSAS